MQNAHWIIGLLGLGALAACGDTDLERGTSGALIGAGAAAATDNNLLAGAAIGAGAGVFADDVGLLPSSR
jgi:hypothetical protein